jgi:hypothetical protein
MEFYVYIYIYMYIQNIIRISRNIGPICSSLYLVTKIKLN